VVDAEDLDDVRTVDGQEGELLDTRGDALEGILEKESPVFLHVGGLDYRIRILFGDVKNLVYRYFMQLVVDIGERDGGFCHRYDG
jgi:hypothetical protein